jgi:tRNA-Thr(GGU) m(6)t(6)A37 methyltransferase TsaA
MSDATVTYRTIGVVRSEHTDPEEAPIQPVFAQGCQGRAEILPEYADGLDDLDGFSHIYLICHLHRARAARMTVTPFLDSVERGLFATRAACRPNPIGLSIVRLVKREGNVLHLDDVDLLDGTPLLDIKPYCARFDCITGTRNGWHDSSEGDSSGKHDRRE